ncbi:MAG: hypothetical protein GTN76_10795 [Candidatus Aenigmarchaeota archaeon]|nr:hypothetical protein [Candidatus Aenigmarchaeota archaeon]
MEKELDNRQPHRSIRFPALPESPLGEYSISPHKIHDLPHSLFNSSVVIVIQRVPYLPTLIRRYIDMVERRKFPRVPVTESVMCLRYGRPRTMRTLDVSLGGLKLEANFDLRIGESIDLAILTNGTRIYCRGSVLAIEEFWNKVQARLRFTRISEVSFKKLSNYLGTLSRGKGIPFQRVVIGGLFILSAYIAYLFIRTYFFQ